MRQKQELEVSLSVSFAHNSITQFEAFKNIEKSFIEADIQFFYNDKADNFKKIEEKDEETLESQTDDDYIAVDFLTV